MEPPGSEQGCDSSGIQKVPCSKHSISSFFVFKKKTGNKFGCHMPAGDGRFFFIFIFKNNLSAKVQCHCWVSPEGDISPL